MITNAINAPTPRRRYVQTPMIVIPEEYSSRVGNEEDESSNSGISDEDEVNKLQDLLNEEVIKYHSLLDRNYYYKNSDGNIMNNIK